MMNSYHYCYYYCYDYDDYPSCCCCSILLNDFLSLDEHDLLHLETCLIFSVPQKDNSNGKRPLTVCYLPLVSDLQTSLGHYHHLCFSGHGFRAWAWLNNFNMTFMQTYFIFMMTSSVPHHRMNYAHCQYAHCWFISAFITSISDCLLSQQSQISSQMWLINLFSDCNWTTTALLHQWCPWCPAHSVLVIWM